MSKGSINIKSRSTYNFTKEYTAECDIYIYVINWCMKHFFDILEYSDYKITSVGYNIFWYVLVTHWLMLAKCLGKSSSYQKVLAIFFSISVFLSDVNQVLLYTFWYSIFRHIYFPLVYVMHIYWHIFYAWYIWMLGIFKLILHCFCTWVGLVGTFVNVGVPNPLHTRIRIRAGPFSS